MGVGLAMLVWVWLARTQMRERMPPATVKAMRESFANRVAVLVIALLAAIGLLLVAGLFVR
jgi:hypothetical protein